MLFKGINILRHLTNLVGKEFGKLIVIEYKGESKWLCQCECGNRSIVQTGHLNSGSTISCGCERGNHTITREDLIGKTFGRWTVIEEVGRYKNTTIIIWKCRCECGKIKDVLGNALRSGASTSCGCYAKEKTSKINFRDLTNKIFDRLTVIKEFGRTTNGGVTWLCRCSCGKEVIRSTGSLTCDGFKSCGCGAKRERPNSVKNIEGEKFGYLIVLRLSNERTDGRKLLWE